MKQFLKKGQVVLVNGGYLSNDKEAPINNDAFVKAQKHAEYIITFAEMAKGKDFKGKQADSLEELKAAVTKSLADKDVAFVEKPTEVTKKLSKQLADEAMAFVKYQGEATKVEKINKFLQDFVILKDFEDYGLFFEDGIVKLNKIYTLAEVVTAVQSTIDLIKE